MICYHCCNYNKLQKYKKTGYIIPPVRAWPDFKDAQRFSIQTGRQIILRLRFKKFVTLEGHKGKAIFTDEKISVECI